MTPVDDPAPGRRPTPDRSPFRPSAIEPIVVVGASAGGIASLKSLVAGLPAEFPGAVFVVLHLAPDHESVLPQILARAGTLPAETPKDGDPIRAGRIYVAPPNHHLLVDNGRIGLSRGPKENRFRPSIDALFRSAAYTFGPKVVGVVLSGSLDDGTSGLWTVKRFGGTTLVQEPGEAAYESMPLNALRHVDVDHCVSTSEMGELLMRLARERRPGAEVTEGDVRRTELEIGIAAGENAFEAGIMEYGNLSPLTCPECHGALVKLTEDALVRYRCHTGHAYSPSALFSGITEEIEATFSQVTRALEECVMLLEDTAAHFDRLGETGPAEACRTKAREIEARANVLQRATAENNQFGPDVQGGNGGSEPH